MSPLCAACATGAVDIEGHAALRVRSMGAEAVAFECNNCHALWSRTYSKTGHFFWLRRLVSGATSGTSLPRYANADAVVAIAPAAPGPDSGDHWLASHLNWSRARPKIH